MVRIIILMEKTLELKKMLNIKCNKVEIKIDEDKPKKAKKNNKSKNKKKVEAEINKIKFSKKSKREPTEYFATSKYFIAPPVSEIPIPEFE
jgi:hypothetical protein